MKWLAAALLLGTMGCAAHLRAVAVRTFSADHFCPKERITVKPMPGVPAHTMMLPEESPPDEVAVDPARLAIWRQQQHERQSQYDALNGDLFDASGCDQHEIYACIEMDEGASCSRRMPWPLSPESLVLAEKRAALLGIAPHKRKIGIAVEAATSGGVTVRFVLPGSLAMGKIEAGDVITQANSVAVSTAVELERHIEAAGDSCIVLTVRRRNEDFSVALGNNCRGDGQ